ncbi:hypothetical protein VFPBJ_11199 [Purpureocillium lilacinum]|uniref:Uncharacterized protein n=1 Tax=Purpureocillium lilacinum TaxID=33203 RepID=A0A179FKN2_PURLI|nr:hypothetical protein VFPBJ_11199 [Purpureocillium lilacinum]
MPAVTHRPHHPPPGDPKTSRKMAAVAASVMMSCGPLRSKTIFITSAPLSQFPSAALTMSSVIVTLSPLWPRMTSITSGPLIQFPTAALIMSSVIVTWPPFRLRMTSIISAPPLVPNRGLDNVLRYRDLVCFPVENGLHYRGPVLLVPSRSLDNVLRDGDLVCLPVENARHHLGSEVSGKWNKSSLHCMSPVH